MNWIKGLVTLQHKDGSSKEVDCIWSPPIPLAIHGEMWRKNKHARYERTWKISTMACGVGMGEFYYQKHAKEMIERLAENDLLGFAFQGDVESQRAAFQEIYPEARDIRDEILTIDTRLFNERNPEVKANNRGIGWWRKNWDDLMEKWRKGERLPAGYKGWVPALGVRGRYLNGKWQFTNGAEVKVTPEILDMMTGLEAKAKSEGQPQIVQEKIGNYRLRMVSQSETVLGWFSVPTSDLI